MPLRVPTKLLHTLMHSQEIWHQTTDPLNLWTSSTSWATAAPVNKTRLSMTPVCNAECLPCICTVWAQAQITLITLPWHCLGVFSSGGTEEIYGRKMSCVKWTFVCKIRVKLSVFYLEQQMNTVIVIMLCWVISCLFLRTAHWRTSL